MGIAASRYGASLRLIATIAAVLALGSSSLWAQQTAGVFVDAEGVLHKRSFADPGGELTRQRIAVAKASLDRKLAAASPLRKVSLNRLEQAIDARLAAGKPITDEMRYLAGLTRLKFAFCYPDSGDVIVAGPAEGFAADLSDRVRGIHSGRPVLELEDLVVALRMFPAGAEGGPVVGCSIDPTTEGLARMQQFIREVFPRATPSDADFIADGLRRSLGMQKIRVLGVPPDTHFAQVMVEADYRMKLIGIGLEQPPIRLASYVERVNPSQVAANALERWYFVPDYKCIRAGANNLSMELVGEGVKLVGAGEMVSGDGSRRETGSLNRASRGFVENFTEKYPDLAAKSPVFAQLRNLIDMVVMAAFIQRYDYYGETGWELATLADESAFPVETHSAPLEVESAVNSIWKRNRLMTPIGGGVNIQAARAMASENLLDDEGQLDERRGKITIELAEGQWWWD